METEDKIILIGLPSTGKTTFLAALWYLVDGSPIQTTLRLDKLHGERDYLNQIRNNWINCEQLDRTRPIDEQCTSMKLTSETLEQSIDLQITDLSGETYQKQWVDRLWTHDFIHQIAKANGALFFVHPDGIIEPTRIDQVTELAGVISEQQNHEFQEMDYVIKEWDPKQAPTQVQLVELLQFIEENRQVSFPYKIALIISAWEKVQEFYESPTDWLSQRMPLLYQYLISNRITFPLRIYGVSAQGGDYTDAEKLREHIISAERIIIIGEECVDHDLTVPIFWLMEDHE